MPVLAGVVWIADMRCRSPDALVVRQRHVEGARVVNGVPFQAGVGWRAAVTCGSPDERIDAVDVASCGCRGRCWWAPGLVGYR